MDYLREGFEWFYSLGHAYQLGGTPLSYDSGLYRKSQMLASLDPTGIYRSLYSSGAQFAQARDYAKNRPSWNGVVRYPGTSQFGGYQSGGSALQYASKNIMRLYR